MKSILITVVIAPIVLFVSVFGLLVVSLLGGSATAQSVGTVGVGTHLKPGAIPQRYVDLIAQAATTCPEITAPLLAAQIQAESSWNPDAVGPMTYTGERARGIAQFMPATWAAVGRDHNGNGTASPMEPGDAIPTQAAYMCQQIDNIRRAGISGDLINLALAAYNAGFGTVQRYQGIPPYPETQEYVRRIRKLAETFAQTALQGRPAPGDWVTPVAGTCTSGFGPRWDAFHEGLDLAGPLGTPIVAAASGTVIAAGPASGYGLWVKIRHTGGVVTVYGHIHTVDVAVGQTVRAGQRIATRGNRGESTGPHLHYQVEVNGKAVDPIAFHQQRGAPPLCG